MSETLETKYENVSELSDTVYQAHETVTRASWVRERRRDSPSKTVLKVLNMLTAAVNKVTLSLIHNRCVPFDRSLRSAGTY